MRVVSLLPSATEICYALGVEPVAVSHECDYPPGARDRPVVSRSRIANAGSSEQVNEQVRDADAAGWVQEIDRSVLRRADPDLVIAQGVCDVCAIDESSARETVEETGIDADVLTLHSHTLSGVLDEIELVGAATGRATAASDLVDRLHDRIDAVETAAAGVENHPRVVVLDWMSPVMVAGHWIPEMVTLAGGRYGLASPGDRSTPREWEAIRRHDPEVLVAAPCGFDLERTRMHVSELTDRSGWSDLTAVRSGRVYAMDGDGYVNRPGPRLIETLEYLAGVIQPERFESPPEDTVRQIATTQTI